MPATPAARPPGTDHATGLPARKTSPWSVLLSGFLTGLLLQAAVGPVFFYVVGTAMRRTLASGLLAVLAVTVVDYLYIALAVLGIGTLLEKPRVRRVMGIGGSIVLVAFGAFMVGSTLGTPPGAGPAATATRGDFSSFLAAFLLTLSSPLTVVFWTGLFATKAVEKGYVRRHLAAFGVSAGLATPVFLGLAVTIFSAARSWIPPGIIRVLNAAVGGVLAVYGVARLARLLVSIARGRGGEGSDGDRGEAWRHV